MNETVIVKNLNIKSGDNSLVKNICFDINKGEIFGLVGESGSGKTITAKSIINLLPDNLNVSVDEIWVANKDISKLSKSEIKNHIGKNVGYIPQNTVFYLHPMIKIKNQILDGYMHHVKKNKKASLEKVSSLLNNVGFENPKEILNLYPWQLSGGMRQRVNIAMALLSDPKLIIADEPTTALDSTVQRQVMDLFYKINKNLGISILLISHDLGLIKHYSNRLAVMYKGEIVEMGNSNEVFTNPKHSYTQHLIEVKRGFYGY